MSDPSKFSEEDHINLSHSENVEVCGVQHQIQRPSSPLSSYVSLKSDRSMAEPSKFSDETEHIKLSHSEKVEICDVQHQIQRPSSPLSSYVSLKSDRSMAEPPKFSDETEHLKLSHSENGEVCGVQHQIQRPSSPLSSYVSLKSDRSMVEPPKFSEAEHLKLSLSENTEVCGNQHQIQRPSSPLSSYMSLKSDRSMVEPPKFSEAEHVKFSHSENVKVCDIQRQIHRPPSPLSSFVSLKSDMSMVEPLKFSEAEQLKLSHLENVEVYGVQHQIQRPSSPLSSCVSFKSDRSMAEPLKFSEAEHVKFSHSENVKVCDIQRQIHRPSSPLSSFVSLKSDMSMVEPLKFSEAEQLKLSHLENVDGGLQHQIQRTSSPLSSCVSLKSDRSMAEPLKFSDEAGNFKPRKGPEQLNICQSVDAIQSIRELHKAHMKKKYESLCEGFNKHENKILLNKIYTKLYIIEGEREGVNEEHEVVQLEKAKIERLQGTPINCNDIFHPFPDPNYGRHDEKENIKTVLTKGIAGIGKTVSVQKFILDWAEGKANQDVDFLFVLPFRELNLVKDDQYSLHKLLLDFHPELLEADTRIYDLCKVLFVFDGVDESRITLTFSGCENISDVSTSSSVSMLMSNLIKGELLPSALIWITSRPAAAGQIPSRYISRVTEVQGFNDHQKEEYFRKRISDQHQASQIISHIRTVKSLHIMCHIPVFSCITATVLQKILEQDLSADIPKTLTEMYIHFLIIQSERKRQKFDESIEGYAKDPKSLLQKNRDLILKLAELAFKGLMNGNVLFYDEDLRSCGIDVNEASVHSGFCTEFFEEESVINSRKVYCFVHLSFQEFFAGLFAFANYLNKSDDILKMFHMKKGRCKPKPGRISLDVFLSGVADKALQSDNGHLDLFLRFLCGVSLVSNQRLLQGLLAHVEDDPESMVKVVKNLRQSQKQNIRPERWINLSHCLTEMKDTSISEDIQAYFRGDGRRKRYLSSAHCSALANMLLMAEDVQEELDLKKYNTTSMQAVRRLIPAVRNCRKAILAGCNLTDSSCETVASALQPANSPLRELDMSNNDVLDSGVKLISIGLKSSHCKLETLRLKCCKLTVESCETVASALLSANSCLRELDLSNNELQDSGVEWLAAGLKSPHCKLEILSLAGSKLTSKSCETLASVLQSDDCHLRELDLNKNDLQDSGLEWLSAGLKICKLEKLRLATCNLTSQSCKMLASGLQSVNCLLKDLDLSNNDLQDTGMEILSAGLKSPHCKLNILRLSICNLTDQSCATVASVFQSANCLIELNLSKNDLQDSGMEMLSSGLKSSLCKLEILRMSGCFITEKGCSVLASALTLNPLHLRELDLSCNHPGDLGVQLLTARLKDTTCNLKILNLEHEGKLRITSGLRRYACDLTLDPNTAHAHLSLSDRNRTVTYVAEEQSYPHHPDRFECCPQVLCTESLSGCCSWEVEWTGQSKVYISASYKSIGRKGQSNDCDCKFGFNDRSWSLVCSENSFSFWHNNEETKKRTPSSSSRSKRIGVYLNYPAGTLSFYNISDKTKLIHLHTFSAKFTEHLYAGFGLDSGSSVSLCPIPTEKKHNLGE